MADDAASGAGQDAAALELEQLRALYAAALAEIATLREREAATGEILRVIATSKSALMPVFEALAERAYRLCHASSARVYLVEGDDVHIVASVAESDEAVGAANVSPERLRGHTV